MSTISKAAGLSRRYTAHCVRPTVVRELADAGFSNADICKITGHKSTRTVERYLMFGNRRETYMHAMCQQLHGAMHSDPVGETISEETEGRAVSITKEATSGSVSRMTVEGLQTEGRAVSITEEATSGSVSRMTVNLNGPFHGCTFNFGK